jgi:hypothetical protein
VVIATTDRDGAYQSDFAPIPGDEMVTVWAELEGYTFEPEEYYWRHYYGRESRTLNFVAVPLRLPKSGRLRKSLNPQEDRGTSATHSHSLIGRRVLPPV